jgi:hypothetical protein
MLLLFSAVLRGKLNSGKERREMDVRGRLAKMVGGKAEG